LLVDFVFRKFVENSFFGGMMKRGVCRAKVEASVETNTGELSDVAGVDEAKMELQEVSPLKRQGKKYVANSGLMSQNPSGRSARHWKNIVYSRCGRGRRSLHQLRVQTVDVQEQ
jgi:hypothetical protein